MKTLRNCLIAAACAVSAPAFTQSLTQEQRNLLNHLAQVMVIQHNCPEYESNDGLIAVALARFNVRLSEPGTEAFFKARYAEQEKGMRAGKAACIVGWGLYGKGGRNVPNLLVER